MKRLFYFTDITPFKGQYMRSYFKADKERYKLKIFDDYLTARENFNGYLIRLKNQGYVYSSSILENFLKE